MGDASQYSGEDILALDSTDIQLPSLLACNRDLQWQYLARVLIKAGVLSVFSARRYCADSIVYILFFSACSS